MANLTQAAAPFRFRFPHLVKRERHTVDSSAAQTIYRGQPIIIDVSADSVNVTPWTSSITLVTATDKFIGIAAHNYSVASGDVESTTDLEVITAGEIGIKSSVFTRADIGKIAVFTDSGTLAAGVAVGAADKCPCGKIVNVLDGYVYIELLAPNIVAF